MRTGRRLGGGTLVLPIFSEPSPDLCCFLVLPADAVEAGSEPRTRGAPMSTHQPSTEPARITVVESEACHFCDDARRALEQLADSYPLTVATVDVRSEAGQRLMRVHRASMSPLVLVDGEFFSHGRLPRRKLANVLVQRQNSQLTWVG
jgi:glutaredoxin